MTRTAVVSIVGLLTALSPCVGEDTATVQRPAGAGKPVEEALARELKGFSYSGSFAGALERLQRLSGLKIGVDWKVLELAGAKRSKAVRVTARNARAEQILDLILMRAAPKGTPLGWHVEGETVRVRPQKGVLARRFRSLLPAASATTRPAAERGLQPMPQRPSSPAFDFNETPLEAVVEFFRDLTGANFYVNWKALATVGVTRETLVTLKVSDVSVGHALTLVTDQLTDTRDKYRRVYWVVDEGIVLIAPGSALNTRPRTRTFDLGTLMFRPIEVRPDQRELSGQAADPSPETGGLGRGGRSSGAAGGGYVNFSAGSPRPPGEQDALIEIIRRSIGEDMWEPMGKGSIRVFGNRLVVTQTLLGYKLLEESLRVR